MVAPAAGALAMRLDGRLVDDTGRPVAGGRVWIYPGDAHTDSDDAGAFGFDGLASGRYRLWARKDELYVAITMVTVRAGREPVTLTMRRGLTLRVQVVDGDAPVTGARAVMNDEAVAITDERGCAIVRGIGPDFQMIDVMADGYAPAYVSMWLADDPGGTIERTLQLTRGVPVEDDDEPEPGATLRGSTVDAEGGPVAGAWVVAVTADSDRPDDLDGRSDDHGRFELRGLAAGAYDVFAHWEGRASALAEVTIADDAPTDVELVLRDARVAGVVVDTDGAPIAGAEVRAEAAVVNGDVTDSQGRFDLGAFPAGEYEVVATWPHQHPRCLTDGTMVRTGAPAVRLVLPRLATLTGRVLLDGTPMTSFGVLLTRPQFVVNRDPIGVHGTDGRFELRGVTPGAWGLLVAGPGTSLERITEISVAEGARIDLGDISLTRGQRVTGQVRDAAGDPVAGARVAIGDLEGDHDPLQRWFSGDLDATTDARGRFVLDGVPARSPGARPRIISAIHPRRGTSRDRDLPDAGGEVELTLLATGAIEGVIDGLLPDRIVTMMARCGRRSARTAMVESAGEFRFDGLPPGTYELEMIVPPGRPRAAPVTVAVAAGQRAAVRLIMPRH